MKVRSSQQAFENVKAIAAAYPGIVAVFQDIAEIASIQSAADAADKRLTDTKNKIKQAEDDLEALKVAQAESLKKQDALIAARIAAGDKEIADRAAAAETVNALSAAQAKEALNAANKEADRIVTVAKNAAAAIDARAATAQAQLDTLNADVTASQAALDALNGQIAAIEQHKATLAAALQATG